VEEIMGKTFKNFRIVYFITFIFIISISFSGCAWIPFWGDEEEEVELESEFEEFEESQPREMEELKADLQTLQSHQEESQVKLEELEDTVSSLFPRVSEIEETQGEGSGEGAANSAEIEELKDTIHKLQSQIGDLKDNINEMEFEAELRTTSPPPPQRVARGASRGGARRGYDKALRLFNIKQFKESLRLFKSLDNRRTPTNYRDNVVFWIGVCYLRMEDYEKAIEKFNVVIDDYGSGNKVIDSMYLTGVAYNALGEKSNALDYLEQALKNGPSADLRRKIKTKINEIEG
jgi:TolA-binding protein